MFLLHLDDIDYRLRHSSIIKYVHEAVIYVSGNESESIQKKLNADILEVHNWLTDNNLSLNLEKGKNDSMTFDTSVRFKNAAPLNIGIKGTSINQTSSYKCLGTHLDSTPALDDDFNSKYKRLSSRLQLLSKLRPNLNVKAANMICKSIVIPVFTYYGAVNLNLPRTSLGKLDQIHERAVGIITKNQYSEVNTNNELYETSCLPNHQNIYHKAATSTYDWLFQAIITLKVNKKQQTLDRITKIQNKSSPKWILWSRWNDLQFFNKRYSYARKWKFVFKRITQFWLLQCLTILCLINHDFNLTLICLNFDFVHTVLKFIHTALFWYFYSSFCLKFVMVSTWMLLFEA